MTDFLYKNCIQNPKSIQNIHNTRFMMDFLVFLQTYHENRRTLEFLKKRNIPRTLPRPELREMSVKMLQNSPQILCYVGFV